MKDIEDLKRISRFKGVFWSQIPDYGMYSEQVIDYINEVLISYFPGNLNLSSNMINNYVKQSMIPRPKSKKYDRKQIAILMVITILKQVIPLESIKQGIGLQVKILDISESYDEFMCILVHTMQSLLNSLSKEEKLVFKGFEARRENISLTLAIHAFCFQVLTVKILDMKGLYDKEFI